MALNNSAKIAEDRILSSELLTGVEYLCKLLGGRGLCRSPALSLTRIHELESKNGSPDEEDLSIAPNGGGGQSGITTLPGHSIRIGLTLEYLLRGLSFEVVKVKGRWNGDAFHRYIRDHAMVLAPYMQSAPPEMNDQFIQITIPSARN